MKLLSNNYNICLLDEEENEVGKIVDKVCQNGPQEEPSYICHIDNILAKHTNWIGKLSRVVPFYAVKCNDSSVVSIHFRNS